ncbi:MAG: hypothetical protein ACRENP_10210 [Longimicrobiales bacterium]
MTATVVAAIRDIPGSLLGGPPCAYFVVTAVTAVRPIHRRLDLAGARRIARHLWRMCFGFWIATGSFFFGQMDEFPAGCRNPRSWLSPRCCRSF